MMVPMKNHRVRPAERATGRQNLKRTEQKAAIAAYAAAMAGTELDLDTALENATLEVLRAKQVTPPRRREPR